MGAGSAPRLTHHTSDTRGPGLESRVLLRLARSRSLRSHGVRRVDAAPGGARIRGTGVRRARRLLPELAFVVTYAGAVLLGRGTALQVSDLALVWPAASVAAAWALVRRRDRHAAVDVGVGVVLTVVLLMVTGMDMATASVLAAAAAAQVLVFALVLRQRRPELWRSRATQQLSLQDVWAFLEASVVASAVSAIPVGLATLTSDAWSWPTVVVWFARGSVSIFALGSTVVVLRAWWFQRRVEGPRRTRRLVEYTLVTVLSPAAYLLWFVPGLDLPVAFPLIGLTVWVGSRLSLPYVVVHDTLLGAFAVVLTMLGSGPFASIEDRTARLLVAQLFVGMVALIGLSLAVARAEREAAVRDLADARAAVERRANLLDTIIHTMDEGVGVIDDQGRLLMRNAKATALFGGIRSLTGRVAGSEFYGFHRLDGTQLPDEEAPHRVALRTGVAVRDADVLVRNRGLPDGRVVRFNSTPLPSRVGGGVVSVMRDVTAERLELQLAARVQAALLPTQAPAVPGYDLAASFVPEGSVGGDLYDWQRTRDGVVLTVADVMGKGPAAAILAATLVTALHEHDPERDVGSVLAATEERLDRQLAGSGAFITAARLHVRASTGDVAYADAGHGLSVVVRRDGSTERLAAGGPPLGMLFGAPRAVGHAVLHVGDTLVSFSDGVLDGLGGHLDDLGVLSDVVRSAPSAQDVVDGVVAAVQRHGAVDDDLTVVALRRSTPPEPSRG